MIEHEGVPRARERLRIYVNSTQLKRLHRHPRVEARQAYRELPRLLFWIAVEYSRADTHAYAVQVYGFG